MTLNICIVLVHRTSQWVMSVIGCHSQTLGLYTNVRLNEIQHWKHWVQHLAHKKHRTEIHFRNIIKREGFSFYIQRLEKQFLPLTNITNKGQWSLLCVCVCVCWGDNLRCKLYCYCWLFSWIITCVYNQVNSGKPLTRTFFLKKLPERLSRQ